MPFYTSYLWRGVELNDGVSYLVALRDADFDSQNEASPSYAERQYATPMLLGATLQSGSIPITVQVKSTSKLDFETKVNNLQRLFSTTAATAYQFQRKMAHEAAYRYLDCTVTSFVLNRLERTVKIMLSTEDRRWKDTSIAEWTTQLFEQFPTETHTVTNAGFGEVEPVITFTPLSVPATTNQPRFWRKVTLYVTESRQFDKLPLLISQGWDTSGLVSLDKVRADGLDISVTFVEGAVTLPLPRIVAGTASDRRIWVQLGGFPVIHNTQLTAFVTTVGQNTLTLGSSTGRAFSVPGSGKVAIDDEIVAYTGYSYLDASQQVVRLTGCTRGVDGTVAALHQVYTRVKFPLNFFIYYGYGAGYEKVFANNYTDWLHINYDTSTNNEWVFERPTNPTNVNAPASSPYTIGFQPTTLRPPRTGEYVWAGTDNGGTPDVRNNLRAALYGAYGGSNKALTRLVMNIQNAPRKPDQVRFKVLLKGSSFPVAGVARVGFKIVRAGFNIPGQEVSTTLTVREHAGTTPTSYDTGYLNTDYSQSPGSHLMLDSVISAQPPVNVQYENFVVLEALHIKLDTTYGAAPTTAYPSLPIEYGLTSGNFILYIKVRNITTGDTPFEITASNFQALQQLVIDADARTITGGTLTSVSYTNPTWLRLVAGVNSIEFTTHTGSGAVNAAIVWRNRY